MKKSIFIRCFVSRFKVLVAVIRNLFFPGDEILELKNNRINVGLASGFGYGNLGDEAQLNYNLERWKSVYPSYLILAFSPDPIFTKEYHGVRSVLASRSAILGAGSSCGIWLMPKIIFKPLFIFQLVRFEFSAILLRAGIAPFFLTSKESSFLNELNTLRCLHISGGGFITGKTYTRMMDTILLMRLCKRLRVPYFLTGHTIGLANGRIDKWLLKKSLNSALRVGLRDPNLSRSELVSIGVPNEILSDSVDDALFCSSDTSKCQSGVLPNINNLKKYFVVNYHWWGMSDETKKDSELAMVNGIKRVQSSTGLTPVFLSMHESDLKAINSLSSEIQGAIVLPYMSRFEQAREIISGADFLISFKHHPLIFALGEGVPVLAVSYDEYYFRKNFGALANHNQENYLCNPSKDISHFELMIDKLVENRSLIKLELKDRNEYWKNHQETEFLDLLKKLRFEL